MKRLVIFGHSLKNINDYIIMQNLNPIMIIKISVNNNSHNSCLNFIRGYKNLPYYILNNIYLPNEIIAFLSVSGFFEINENQIKLYTQDINSMSSKELLFNLFMIVEPGLKTYRLNRFPKFNKLISIIIARQYEKLTNQVITGGSYVELFEKYKSEWFEWLKSNNFISS